MQKNRLTDRSIRRLRTLLLVLPVFLLMFQIAKAQESVSPHGKLMKGLDCSSCHRSDTWKPVKKNMNFDHKITGFALVGKHKVISCQSCHLNLRFDEPKATANTCSSCHIDVHQGKLGDDCQSCHNETSFQLVDGRAIHMRTSFPLTGAHAVISCESCHKTRRNGAFAPLSTSCYSCHEQDYVNAKSVNHVANNFPTNCTNCHSTSGWGSSKFKHAVVANGFALLGAHQQLRCSSCHATPSFKSIFPATSDQDCYTCHTNDYNRAHGSSGFPKTCTDCHNVNTWGDAQFDHATVSNGFALLGAHKNIKCSACHELPSYKSIFPAKSDQDCYSCHTSDYNRAHGSSGFPTTCTNCHNVNTWGDAQFDHAAVANGFALLGAHKTIQCTTCHELPSYAVKFQVTSDQNCYGCHQPDYQKAHSGTGFSTTCTDCHNVNTWGDASFTDHDSKFFPIYSGTHKNTWSTCATCHTDPANYKTFTCLSCHTHDKTTTDQHHTEVQGYSYVSTACYSCHPTGHGGD